MKEMPEGLTPSEVCRRLEFDNWFGDIPVTRHLDRGMSDGFYLDRVLIGDKIIDVKCDIDEINLADDPAVERMTRVVKAFEDQFVRGGK